MTEEMQIEELDLFATTVDDPTFAPIGIPLYEQPSAARLDPSPNGVSPTQDEPPGDGQKTNDTQADLAVSGMVSVVEQEDLFGGVYRSAATVDRDSLAVTLRAMLSTMTLEQVVGLITNEYAELVEYCALAEGARGASRKLSLLFNPHRLDTRTQTSKMSFYEALSQHDTFHSGLARATILRMKERLRPYEVFYLTMQLGINGIDFVNEFPPHVARDFCTRYKLSRSSHVLDPCAGWGGRMTGVSVVVDNYTCFEPATQTALGLGKLAAFINRMRGGGFNAEVNCVPYEEGSLRKSHYDLAITSPPYYDSEVYSDEDTNSLNRYASFEEWCEGFYLQLIDRTMYQMKPGAPFIFNIGDRRWPLTERMKTHAEKMRYNVRRLDGDIVNSAGFGREKDAGEKFFELTK